MFSSVLILYFGSKLVYVDKLASRGAYILLVFSPKSEHTHRLRPTLGAWKFPNSLSITALINMTRKHQCRSSRWVFTLGSVLRRSPLGWFALNVLRQSFSLDIKIHDAGSDISHEDGFLKLAVLLGNIPRRISLNILAMYRGLDSVFSIPLKHMESPIGECPQSADATWQCKYPEK
jgi:hypothetical protein